MFKTFTGEHWILDEAAIRKLVEQSFYAGAVAMVDHRQKLYKHEKERVRCALERRLKQTKRIINTLGRRRTDGP